MRLSRCSAAVLLLLLGACHAAPREIGTGQRFYVFGDFDLDHTGQPAPGDRARVEAMIRDRGGTVAPELVRGTGYAVMGIEPPKPPARTRGIGGSDLDAMTRWAQQDLRARKYQDTLDLASKLRVPVLRQDEFLDRMAEPPRK